MQYVLRLFIVGSSEHSNEAIRNLWAISQGPLKSEVDFAIIDVRDDPETAERNNVFVTPTLIRVERGRSRRIVGDLSDYSQVLTALGIQEDAS